MRNHEQGGGQQQGGGNPFGGGGGFNINMDDLFGGGGGFGGFNFGEGGFGGQQQRRRKPFFKDSEVTIIKNLDDEESFDKRRHSYAILFYDRDSIDDDLEVKIPKIKNLGKLEIGSREVKKHGYCSCSQL